MAGQESVEVVPATSAQKFAMDQFLSAIIAANEASKTFGREDSVSTKYHRIIGGISPNVDATEVGRPILSEDKIGALQAAVSASQNSYEQAATTIALLAKVGVTVFKAMA